jgi:predicted ATPase/class 3 adenylate cyclase/Tfp pilus assembly protein PilF
VPELPTGTVTLLFTDIEGSTQLLEWLGERYVQVLGEHRGLLRAAFAAFEGHEVGVEGDAFFVAFAKARDAAAAAVAGQRALAGHGWPEGAVPRVRMGIHTGEPIVVAGDYAGLDVHRAARICSAGHGEQILLSHTTRELLGEGLPSGVGLRDLGEHQLKDFPRPQRLYQLIIPGLPVDFPPLRTVGAHPTNLPAPLTSFVGRQWELAEACRLLRREQVRLLTLTGPGGIGKTRLALQVAAELVEAFPDGVFVVALAPVSDPGLVVPTIAHTLAVREAAGRSLLESLVWHIGGQRLLLVLDNFEQVLSAAPVIADLLGACRQLKVLMTSRAALHVSGEQEYAVPPLSLPDEWHAHAPKDLMSSESVALFVERARAVDPGFAVTEGNAAALADICRRLDGLPLAIELAAARSKLLSPEALVSRLERRFELLQGGPRDLPVRQQTLRATIDWSYNLLEAGEQSLFARLAVFAGGCTLEAAEAVCDLQDGQDVLDGLAALIDKNLLQPRDGIDGDRRVRMLETIREYALERLGERGETDELARRHADYYLGLAEQAELEVLGPRQQAWYERLDADLDNIRTALTWSLAHQLVEVTGRLSSALMPFWVSRGHVNEGLRWLEAALEHRDSLSRSTLAKALFAKAYLLLQVGAHHRQANALLEESLARFQELEDSTWTVRTISVLGLAAMRAREFERGLALREQAVALARAEADEWNLAMALLNLGLSRLQVEDHARARLALEESLELHRRLGELEGAAVALDGLGMLALAEGNYEQAASLLEEALAMARKVGHVLEVADCMADLAVVALHEGDWTRAGRLFHESCTLAQQAEDDFLIGQCLWGMAVVAAAQGQAARTVRLWAAAATLRYELTIPPSAVRPLEEHRLQSLREVLGSDAFGAEWASGQAMRRDDAIAYAFEAS